VNEPLSIVLHCAKALFPKVRYVFDSLFMAVGVPIVYVSRPPSKGAWLLYGPTKQVPYPIDRCVAIAHCTESWRLFEGSADCASATTVGGLATVLPQAAAGFDDASDIAFDLPANAFYFLASWSERAAPNGRQMRRLQSNSVFARLGVPQDIVDRYLARLMTLLVDLCDTIGRPRWPPREWPQGSRYALVLTHDIDFIPLGVIDTVRQGGKSVLRHLVRQRDPVDAFRAAVGFARAVMQGRDPYGCVPAIIEREMALGLRTSFQVAVGRRHPSDVNYRIEDDRVRDYLRVIPDAGFDLCLHGSYRSTENLAWYGEEVALLARRLGRPLGSRQHFLSFDYDTLFASQEQAGIQYDMSMGYPDRTGPRAGFSYPYFPFCVKEDRPYDVVQISLFLMDVTLQSYLGLKRREAWDLVKVELNDLREKAGCVSAVWHPIVFGGARDPGYDQLFWDMARYVRDTGGLATDGATINRFWRDEARTYSSFAPATRARLWPR
jgi:hypothetical protein